MLLMQVCAQPIGVKLGLQVLNWVLVSDLQTQLDHCTVLNKASSKTCVHAALTQQQSHVCLSVATDVIALDCCAYSSVEVV